MNFNAYIGLKKETRQESLWGDKEKLKVLHRLCEQLHSILNEKAPQKNGTTAVWGHQDHRACE